jgi:ribosomal protein S18 acetylase RimI-like enzyme
MPQSFKIREAIERDIDGIIPVWKQFIKLHADLDPREVKIPHAEEIFRALLRERLIGKDAGILVAAAENEIAGFILMKMEKDDPVFPDPVFGFVEIIAVSEKGRRHGIGEMLYQYAVNWFKERGASSIKLFIIPKNIQASSFWKKMGFSSYLELLYKKIE